jgi:DNA-binding transcriptional ArsR family regulator
VPEPGSGAAGSPVFEAGDSPVFAAVASPARRQLLGLLLEHGPLPVQDLAAHFAMRRPSVSEHLRVLKDAGLVSERRTGRQRYYHLEAAPLQDLSQWLSPYERFWRHKLSGLRDLLDSDGDADRADHAPSGPPEPRDSDRADHAPSPPGHEARDA